MAEARLRKYPLPKPRLPAPRPCRRRDRDPQSGKPVRWREDTLMNPICDLVDLDRYPIHDLDCPRGQRLLAECRATLAAVGAANLPGLLAPQATVALAREAMELRAS